MMAKEDAGTGKSASSEGPGDDSGTKASAQAKASTQNLPADQPSAASGGPPDITSSKRGAAEANSAEPGSDAIALLKEDHRQVEQIFAKYQSAEGREKAALIEEVCKALTVHTMLEEEIFYPTCRQAASDENPLDDAQVEHDSAKLLIADLFRSPERDPYRDAKVRVLAEQIKHHVGEEEKGRTGIFARAEQAGVNTPELGKQIQQRKAELEADDRQLSGRPVALKAPPQAQESAMPNTQTRERDSRGRFMDDDDDRGRSSRSSRGRDDDDRGSSRGSMNRERDEEGRFTSSRGGRGDDDGRGRSSRGRDDDDRDSRDRGRGGWFGDSEGHSEAARRGWDDRGSSRSSRGDYDDDRGSRSSRSRYDDDDRGRSSRGRDDDDRDSRGRGRGGWFGDSEGHSEASRRGWDNPDHGDSGWYGDSRGHSEASRRGWDNPDHGRSGWFGDSEGHSEASRRGWDDRGSSRSSRGGRDDDDDRGRSSRSSRDNDDRDRGRGGWFGDSRGHSEAARRGWDDRR